MKAPVLEWDRARALTRARRAPGSARRGCGSGRESFRLRGEIERSVGTAADRPGGIEQNGEESQAADARWARGGARHAPGNAVADRSVILVGRFRGSIAMMPFMARRRSCLRGLVGQPGRIHRTGMHRRQNRPPHRRRGEEEEAGEEPEAAEPGHEHHMDSNRSPGHRHPSASPKPAATPGSPQALRHTPAAAGCPFSGPR